MMELDIFQFRYMLVNDNLSHYANKYNWQGWKIVIQLSGDDEIRKLDIWCKANCADRYVVHNEHYTLFETLEDAMAFKLRWL